MRDLKEILERDQEARVNKKIWDNPSLTRGIMHADKNRLSEVSRIIHNRGAVLTPEELFYASIIFQHGTRPEHFQIAMELAWNAYILGYERALDMVNNAYSRLTWSLSQSQ